MISKPTQFIKPTAIVAAIVAVISIFVGGCAKPYIFPLESNQTQPHFEADYIVMDDGYQLPLRQWGTVNDSTAIILANHGLNDYSLGFESTGQYLANKNMTLFSYDQRGFGKSKGHGYWHGSQRMIKDNQVVIQLLKDKYPSKKLFLLGESMGGAMVLASMNGPDQKQIPNIAGVILIAPAIWSRESMPWYQRALLWLASHTVPGKELTGQGLDLMPSDNIEMLRKLGRDPLVIKATRVDVLYGLTNLMDIAISASSTLSTEALILYGKKDDIVPRKPTCEWLSNLPSTLKSQRKIIIYDEGYHMLNRDLAAATVLDDISGWVSRQSMSGHQEATTAEMNRLVLNFCND